MLTDPNWLLSTVVQSTATFVAIVAGFIISRLLALSAERSGIQTKVRDIKLQLGIKKQILDDLEKRLLEMDADDFLEKSYVLNMIIESDGQISLREVLKQVTDYNRSEDELRPYWDEAVKATKNAFRIVKDNFSELEKNEDTDVFLKNLGVDLSSYRWKIYHLVFFKMLDEYEKERNPFGAIINSTAKIHIPEFPSIDENTRYRVIEQDIEIIERDEYALEKQLSDLEAQLKQLGQPQGVKLGIIFLVYFSLVGIVIPAFFLPFPVEQFTSAYKWGIFLLFISGLVFFVLYLVKLVLQLTETADTDNSG
jgi:hypothetical protein